MFVFLIPLIHTNTQAQHQVAKAILIKTFIGLVISFDAKQSHEGLYLSLKE